MADVRATFGGSMPEYYDGIMAAGQFDTFAQDLVDRVPARPAGGVLELACGTGVATRRLRERLHREVRLVATDLSEAMLGFARRKLAALALRAEPFLQLLRDRLRHELRHVGPEAHELADA